MFTKLLRWLLPILILAGGYAGYSAIASNAIEPEQKDIPNLIPTVTVLPANAAPHNLLISSHGEISAVETTRLSAQVSGEVVKWHPNFVAGGIVKRGEILFSVEEDNYEAAVLIAEADVASAQAALIEEKARAEVAKRQAKSLPNQQVTDLYLRKPQLLSAQATLKSSQAALKRARRDLINCKVVAPYDALVVSRDLGVGQYVSAGSIVATLHNIETAEVRIPIAGFDSVFLPEQYEGIEATIVKQGLGSVVRKGKIVRDLGVVDSSTRMVSIVVQLEDPYGVGNSQKALPFGSYVEVSFTGKKLENIYKLPQELVHNQKVWVVDNNEVLESREVTILRSEGEYMLVSDGINQNDQIVLTVPEYPRKGMKVKVAGSPKNNEFDVR